MTDSGYIDEWGYCLDDCPAEVPEVACLDEPIFPDFAPGDGYHENFTSSYIQGSGKITRDLDYVTFGCEPGYVFEGSTNITNYAFCHNWNWTYAFDNEATCIRKLKYTRFLHPEAIDALNLDLLVVLEVLQSTSSTKVL